MSRTPDEEILLKNVPEDGRTIGNYRLLRNLGWTEDRYWKAREKLIDSGIIATGRGKGGSVYRLVAEKPVKRPQFASQTTVPVSQTRGEIDFLLRQWGCKGIQWTDNFENGMVLLRFAWTFQKNPYMARLVLQSTQNEQENKQRHRVLLLWLKAAFNAVDAGIVKAEEVFLPFLEVKEGQTLGEITLKQLPALMSGRLLEQGK